MRTFFETHFSHDLRDPLLQFGLPTQPKEKKVGEMLADTRYDCLVDTGDGAKSG